MQTLRAGCSKIEPKISCLPRSSDVVLETRVLVSRCLEDKNESLGLDVGLGSWSFGFDLEHLVLVLVSVLKKKSCSCDLIIYTSDVWISQ